MHLSTHLVIEHAIYKISLRGQLYKRNERKCSGAWINRDWKMYKNTHAIWARYEKVTFYVFNKFDPAICIISAIKFISNMQKYQMHYPLLFATYGRTIYFKPYISIKFAKCWRTGKNIHMSVADITVIPMILSDYRTISVGRCWTTRRCPSRLTQDLISKICDDATTREFGRSF